MAEQAHTTPHALAASEHCPVAALAEELADYASAYKHLCREEAGDEAAYPLRLIVQRLDATEARITALMADSPAGAALQLMVASSMIDEMFVYADAKHESAAKEARLKVEMVLFSAVEATSVGLPDILFEHYGFTKERSPDALITSAINAEAPALEQA